MKLVLPYPPAINQHWRIFQRRILVSSFSRAYKLKAQLLAKTQGVKPIEVGPVAVTMRLYRPRKIGDLDGRLKVTFDCLNGIAWADDDQVEEIHAFRYDDKDNPRVELDITPKGAP